MGTIKVPSYDAPQVRATAAPTPQASSTPNGLVALGQGISQAAQIVEQIQDRASAVAADEKLNQFLELQIQESAKLKSLLGGAAIKPDAETGLTPAEQARQKLDAAKAELEKELGPRAKQMFAGKVDRHLLEFTAESLGHANTQEKVYVLSTARARKDAAVKLAADNPAGAGAAILSAADAATTASRFFKMEENSPEQQAFIAEHTSPVVATAIHAAVKSGSSAVAKNLLETYGGLLSGPDTEMANNLVKVGEDKRIVSEKVREYGSLLDPKGTNIAEVVKKVQEDTTLEKDQVTDILAGVNHLHVAQNQQRKAQIDGQIDSVMAVANARGSWAARSSVEMGLLKKTDPSSAHSLLKAFEAEARADEGKQSVEEVIAARMKFGSIVNDPRFVDMSAADLKREAIGLGKTMGQQLIDAHGHAVNDVNSFRFDQKLIEEVARGSGFISEKSKTGQAGRDDADKLNALTTLATELFQNSRKRGKLTESEQRVEVTKLVNRLKTDEGGWFGIGAKDEPVADLFREVQKIPGFYQEQSRLAGRPLSAVEIATLLADAKRQGLIEQTKDGLRYKPKASTKALAPKAKPAAFASTTKSPGGDLGLVGPNWGAINLGGQ